MATEILGIRHHGPGSARSLLKKLEQMQPDIILIEGPPEAESILPLATEPGMKPPVAILAYEPDKPHNAAYYPFTEFSPEWQAIQFGLSHNIPLRFIDLPMMHKLVKAEVNRDESPLEDNIEDTTEEVDNKEDDIILDPITHIAKLAGYEEGELWWEHTFEQRLDGNEVFEAILEMMTPFRDSLQERGKQLNNATREAYMRKCIRAAQKAGFEKIAVVCGAYHAPALAEMPKAKEDDALLKNLSKIKINCTWIPWTYSRMTFFSGYGAGIHSPGWYSHLWEYPEDNGAHWLSLAAHAYRKNGMDISASHVIESLRLAEMLAFLRNRPRPGLAEFNEAIETVMCFGDSFQLGLIYRDLIVSNRIGSVPESAPQTPLYADLEKAQKKLRLPVKDGEKEYTLDLREENDLNRSRLLHRLNILDINWGSKRYVSGKGTFKEQWMLRWEPEIVVKVIEMGIWGNTVQEAASNYLINSAREQTSVHALASLLEKTIPADLPNALDELLIQLEKCAAVTHDIQELMKAFLPIATISRYGDVRKTETSMLQKLCEGFLARICIGLQNACFSLDDMMAEAMLENIQNVNQGITLIQNDDLSSEWLDSLLNLNRNEAIHGLIKGYVTRLLNDSGSYAPKETATLFTYALSQGNEKIYAANWLEGFLKGGGAILLLDDTLWELVDQWVYSLEKETFTEILPLLRRTFSTFAPVERRQLGEKANHISLGTGTGEALSKDGFNHESAAGALNIIKLLLGIPS